MSVSQQQEALLFTLSFDQLEMMYREVSLTPLEQELFNRLSEIYDEQTISFSSCEGEV